MKQQEDAPMPPAIKKKRRKEITILPLGRYRQPHACAIASFRIG